MELAPEPDHAGIEAASPGVGRPRSSDPEEVSSNDSISTRVPSPKVDAGNSPSRSFSNKLGKASKEARPKREASVASDLLPQKARPSETSAKAWGHVASSGLSGPSRAWPLGLQEIEGRLLGESLLRAGGNDRPPLDQGASKVAIGSSPSGIVNPSKPFRPIPVSPKIFRGPSRVFRPLGPSRVFRSSGPRTIRPVYIPWGPFSSSEEVLGLVRGLSPVESDLSRIPISPPEGGGATLGLSGSFPGSASDHG